MRSLRLSRALAIAAFAGLITTGAALAAEVTIPPEKQIGQVGPYVIRDAWLSTAATCKYPDAGPLKLERISVAAPEVRWPDTDSNVDDQNGKIRFKIIVERSGDNGQTWTTLASSTQVTAKATETTPATLTKRSVPIATSGPNTLLRVSAKITWVKNDGHVRGSLRHWFSYARNSSAQLQGTIEPTPCFNRPT